MLRLPRFILLLAFGSLSLAACSQDEAPSQSPAKIEISEAWARETPQGAPNAALYLTIANEGDIDDRLLSVATDLAAHAGIHSTSEEDGMMRMRSVEALRIPARETISLAPGALHIMLMGLEKPLVKGDEISINLIFEESGEQMIRIPVLGMGERP
ncbi:hypothetical protein JCM17846_12820 [Iodidimonas nitroreducens]|uniref:Copper chaperone PCu(A)C n=1 Tax=Iodidimonas nitroreducens TaxID=1236968 RepID=A0A5A7N883_9PROT|nr:copper chaperone PCu(A)C [Iodidimonas nitroreducens]GAK33685.1 putative lipoprotein [alpha proteobacterium Q-1]GER03600.1 hypothetical protein JCM17846_12820 [Iodidimonas nitroreducens]